jgi:hypothetical protein
MKLNSIVKLEKLLSLETEAISKLWLVHDASSCSAESFATTVPARIAQQIQITSQQYSSVQ